MAPAKLGSTSGGFGPTSMLACPRHEHAASLYSSAVEEAEQLASSSSKPLAADFDGAKVKSLMLETVKGAMAISAPSANLNFVPVVEELIRLDRAALGGRFHGMELKLEQQKLSDCMPDRKTDCLAGVWAKASASKYTSVAQFRADVQQVALCALAFNTDGKGTLKCPDLAKQAMQLVNTCDELLTDACGSGGAVDDEIESSAYAILRSISNARPPPRKLGSLAPGRASVSKICAKPSSRTCSMSADFARPLLAGKHLPYSCHVDVCYNGELLAAGLPCTIRCNGGARQHPQHLATVRWCPMVPRAPPGCHRRNVWRVLSASDSLELDFVDVDERGGSSAGFIANVGGNMSPRSRLPSNGADDATGTARVAHSSSKVLSVTAQFVQVHLPQGVSPWEGRVNVRRNGVLLAECLRCRVRIAENGMGFATVSGCPDVPRARQGLKRQNEWLRLAPDLLEVDLVDLPCQGPARRSSAGAAARRSSTLPVQAMAGPVVAEHNHELRPRTAPPRLRLADTADGSPVSRRRRGRPRKRTGDTSGSSGTASAGSSGVELAGGNASQQVVAAAPARRRSMGGNVHVGSVLGAASSGIDMWTDGKEDWWMASEADRAKEAAEILLAAAAAGGGRAQSVHGGRAGDAMRLCQDGVFKRARVSRPRLVLPCGVVGEVFRQYEVRLSPRFVLRHALDMDLPCAVRVDVWYYGVNLLAGTEALLHRRDGEEFALFRDFPKPRPNVRKALVWHARPHAASAGCPPLWELNIRDLDGGPPAVSLGWAAAGGSEGRAALVGKGEDMEAEAEHAGLANLMAVVGEVMAAGANGVAAQAKLGAQDSVSGRSADAKMVEVAAGWEGRDVLGEAAEDEEVEVEQTVSTKMDSEDYEDGPLGTRGSTGSAQPVPSGRREGTSSADAVLAPLPDQAACPHIADAVDLQGVARGLLCVMDWLNTDVRTRLAVMRRVQGMAWEEATVIHTFLQDAAQRRDTSMLTGIVNELQA